MSIKTAIDSISNHIEDIYDTLELGGEDLTNKDKNINNIYTNIKNRYKDYLANGTDIIWNNWENKENKEETNLYFNNTIEAKMQIELKGNATQSGTPTPEAPQDIHVVTGDNTVNVVGKNLFDKNAIPTYRSGGISKTINSNGDIVITSTTASSNRYAEFQIETGQVLAGKTVRFIGSWTNSSSNYGSIFLRVKGSAVYRYTQNDGRVCSYTYPNDYTSTKIVMDLYANYQGTLNANDYVTYHNVMFIIEDSNMTYEPYQAQTQVIHLGNIELAKIGDYQDKLFHAIQGNSIYDSLDSTTKTSLTVDSWYKLGNIEKITNYNGETITTNYISTTGGLNEGATIYYVVTEPQSIEITDTTLINQLNNLEKLKSYNGVTNILQSENTDLPFIINVTVLQQLT